MFRFAGSLVLVGVIVGAYFFAHRSTVDAAPAPAAVAAPAATPVPAPPSGNKNFNF